MMRGFLASMNATARACTGRIVQDAVWRLGGKGVDTSVEQCLLELGLDARKLPRQAREQLRVTAASVADRTREDHASRRIAFGFFAWYVMAAPDFTPKALRGEGTVSDALNVIQSWCLADPGLVKWVAPDFHRLQAHLSHAPGVRAGP